MQALRDYEVLLGTYEEFVIGYKLNDSRKEPKFEASFADHSHAGSGNYLQFGTSSHIFEYQFKE